MKDHYGSEVVRREIVSTERIWKNNRAEIHTINGYVTSVEVCKRGIENENVFFRFIAFNSIDDLKLFLCDVQELLTAYLNDTHAPVNTFEPTGELTNDES